MEQKYKEFKIVTYYDQTQTHRLVVGTKGNHEQAGRLMRRLAGVIHLDEAEEKVVLAEPLCATEGKARRRKKMDGAPWIRNQMQRQSLPLDAIGLDFYHLAENVHTARRAVSGEESEAGQTWASEVLHAFRHEGYEAAWARLVSWQGRQRGSSEARPRRC